MSNYYYNKGIINFRKKIGRILGIFVLISGLIITSYIFFPLISWQFSYIPLTAGKKTLTFTSGSLTKSIDIDVK